jgi:endoglucanase
MRLLPLLLGAALALTPLLPPSLSAAEIPLNGNFTADTDSNGIPDGWPAAKGGISYEKEDGTTFARLQSGEPGKMYTLYRVVDLPAGAGALEVSFKGRATDLAVGKEAWHDARLIMNFKDAAGQKTGKSPGAPYIRKSTEGWVEKKVKFLVPEGAAALELLPSLMNVKKGTFDITEIKIETIDPSVLKAEAEAKAAQQAKADAVVAEAPRKEAWPPELFVVGNRLKTKEGKEMWLQGVNVVSLEWTPKGERVLAASKEAIEVWKSNIIRLPVKEHYWFGKDPKQSDGGQHYRELVDAVITLAANRGSYVLLDLHRYKAPKPEYAEFWKDAGKRYANHPAVIFDIMNEPHGISWEVWRNGGFVEEKKQKTDEDNFGTEGDAQKNGFQSPGMQGLVDAVRSTGAKNVIAAGGLDYAYDLSGILKGYALEEKEGGNGIMYSTHIYNWKRGWEEKVLAIAEKYPIIVGEVGADVKKMSFIPAGNQEDPYTWNPDMLGVIQKYRLNWTGFSFHPGATPVLIKDWSFTPTPYWGQFAKDALAGKQFEVKKLR